MRADGEAVAAFTNVAEVGDPADVDDEPRRGEAELHRRNQAVAARQQLGLVAMLHEQRDRLVEGRGPVILEGCRIHVPLLHRDRRVLLNGPPDALGRQRKIRDGAHRAVGGRR